MIKGAQKTIAYFKHFPQVVQDELQDIVSDTTLKIHYDAQANAPNAGEMLQTTWGAQKNETQLSQFIDYEFLNNKMTGRVFIERQASKMAAYIEFGTGASAAGYVPILPKQWQAIARTFYVNGKGTLIKKPFLLPAFFRHQDDFVRDIRSMLRRITK